MSDVLTHNSFTNIGSATRVSRIIFAKAFCILAAYLVMTFGGFVSMVWLALPVFIALYLLFTGLVGWDPINALDRRIDDTVEKLSVYRAQGSALYGV